MTDEEQPNIERHIAMREQALKDLAVAIGTYYRELRETKVPRELAFELILDYQQHWFEQEGRQQ